MSNYTVKNFLNEHRIEKDENLFITHTSMKNPKGKFHIPDNEMLTFHELYDKYIADTNNQPLHIIERHNDYSPILIDIDERYDIEGKRVHLYKHIEGIVNLYIEEIVNCLEIEKNDKRLLAFVFEKPEISKYKGIKKE